MKKIILNEKDKEKIFVAIIRKTLNKNYLSN